MIRKLLIRFFHPFNIEARNGDPQMTRYHIFACRWFKIFVHEFHRSDGDDPHDHPWNFWSILLKGSYTDCTIDGLYVQEEGYLPIKRTRKKWLSIIRKRSNDIHFVTLDSDKRGKPIKAWTLLIRGKTQREWGFHVRPDYWVNSDEHIRGTWQMRAEFPKTPDGLLWVPWRDYMDLKFGEGRWVTAEEKAAMLSGRQTI